MWVENKQAWINRANRRIVSGKNWRFLDRSNEPMPSWRYPGTKEQWVAALIAFYKETTK